MGKRVALVTGAGGEMGRMLVPALHRHDFEIVALDLAPAPAEFASLCRESVQLDVTDAEGVSRLFLRHGPGFVFHLAAVLSSRAEKDYEFAHRVNVGATLELFNTCRRESAENVRFLFPSSIAVYGLPDAAVKQEQGALKEWQWTTPVGIYGCNKLYCELVGSYLSHREPGRRSRIDFRSIRFPGLISAETLPTGGTTDYAPEMIHAAARHEPYTCFVEETSRLPFMTMPDAVAALLQLAEVDEQRLIHRVFNIRGFSCTAGEIRDEALKHFPQAEIDFRADPARQAIVDSWPADVDDSRARREWELDPEHGKVEAFRDYLVPALRKRYAEEIVARQQRG